MHKNTLCSVHSYNWRPLMSETPAHRDDEIDLFELFIKLWEGKWTIILAMIGATILGMFYLLILPNSYSGTTFMAVARAHLWDSAAIFPHRAT
ncbi:MAG: hypothetical protein EVA86_04130 [Rhodobacteraceae bacterium]|nr:MAG: hypothetical protein EVA86_04130 [Paracoccaceae bacterium]